MPPLNQQLCIFWLQSKHSHFLFSLEHHSALLLMISSLGMGQGISFTP